jgi:DnaJ-class molecular chaperone
MPTDGYERELARSVDAVGEGGECPDCGGTGYVGYVSMIYNQTAYERVRCSLCNGTGIEPQHDAMDDADSAYERSMDR